MNASIADPLFVLWNLGMGDAIICNGLVHDLLDRYEKVIVPSYVHNYPSVRAMFEEGRVEVVPVQRDQDSLNRAQPHNALHLGVFSKTGFNFEQWDREFYRQAGIDPECRWSRFRLPRKDSEVRPPSFEYAFVHDDHSRGFRIDTSTIQRPVVRPQRTDSIFAWCRVIENASEIHCIDSAFFSLVESLDCNAKKYVLHASVRNTIPPTMRRKNWDIH